MAIKSLSTRDLRRELARRERGATRLIARRNKLQRRLDGILGELEDLGVEGGSGRGGGRRGRKPGRKPGRKSRRKGRKARKAGGTRRRAKNKMTLPEAIVGSFKTGATVTPADAAKRVKSKGFKSTSSNFGMMVSNALSKDKRFKRLSRGKYQRVA